MVWRLRNFKFIFMSVFLTYMSVFCAYRGQKKISDFMGVDSQVAVNCPVGTWVT